MKELTFYDIEIFEHDALVIFKNINNEVLGAWHNKWNGLREFIEDRVLVGYNNHYYDDKILTGMLAGWSTLQLKALNDDIILRKRTGQRIDAIINSLDCFQQIDPGMPGLKKIEGNMGRSIMESNTSFDIDRVLTPQEFQEVFDYCAYDIETTIEVYKLRETGYFEAKKLLLEMLPEGMRVKARRWNTTTISANVLKPGFTDAKRWSSMRIDEDMLDLVPNEVVDMWKQINSVDLAFKTKKTIVDELDCKIEFAFGGLHGAHKKIKRVENLIMWDVTSMYPNIILNLNALGEDGCKVYQGILDRRVAIKHMDKIMSDALKLILNSAYGQLNAEYSKLYNPRAAYSVCVYGQIALYELCKRLYATGCKIININTDGVGFTAPDSRYKMVQAGWEKDFNLGLEEDMYDLFVQRDVNNYIGKKGSELKCKGGDVNRYLGDAHFKNNNARILDLALVNHVLYEADVLETLRTNLDQPHLYQYILQAGGTYQGVFDREGNQYQKVNRIFAVKKDGVCLLKKRIDNGLVHFPDAPENMLVWNGECSDLEDFKKVVDLNHYYQIVMKRLEKWRA